MITYYITRNRQGQIEEVFTDGILARSYAEVCGFTLEKIVAPAKGV